VKNRRAILPYGTLLTGVLNMRGLLGEGAPVLPEEERRQQEADYEARRCPACGCHPEEHGGDEYY
jgi:hypothetical protein